MAERKKILFFAHAVSMAHLTRPLKWIDVLDRSQYDIYLASNPMFQKYVPKEGVTFIPCSGIDPKKFLDVVEKSGNIYDTKTFNEHIEEDLRIMNEIKPDLVIGDYRLSLSVSCRKLNIKYINVTNAYWSPQITMKFPLPESPAVRKMGETISRLLLAPFMPMILKFNFGLLAGQLKKALAKVQISMGDFRQVLTDGDVTVYCDSQKMIPLDNQSGKEKFIGPILWSMPVALPTWWDSLDPQRQKIFVTLGSTGNSKVLPLLIKTLAKLDANIIVALAGKEGLTEQYSNVYVTDFLPMEEACRDAALVVCNGGSPVSYAALSSGIPVLGIICNNDQLLNMAHIEKFGAGKVLRYWNLSATAIQMAVTELLGKTSYKAAAVAAALDFAETDTDANLRKIVSDNT